MRIKIAVNGDSTYDGAQLGRLLAVRGIRAGPLSVEYDRAGGLRRYTLLASAYDLDIDVERLARAIRDNAPVQELSIIPLENEVG
ncbi:hypothetical protein [Paracoccus actinidiae]|uniref:hypothetical protein n=1 Tax=Paracoccus actinidiae TaxID=3064531 RepID=UPI0027D286FC|nr:hypothetical protein [Paracoccus sp. M09]